MSSKSPTICLDKSEIDNKYNNNQDKGTSAVVKDGRWEVERDDGIKKRKKRE